MVGQEAGDRSAGKSGECGLDYEPGRFLRWTFKKMNTRSLLREIEIFMDMRSVDPVPMVDGQSRFIRAPVQYPDDSHHGTPCSSAVVESFFSRVRKQKNHSQNAMSHDTLEKRAYISVNHKF
jgi:hypothetical protein